MGVKIAEQKFACGVCGENVTLTEEEHDSAYKLILEVFNCPWCGVNIAGHLKKEAKRLYPIRRKM